MIDLQYESKKVERHLLLALTIEAILAILIAVPVWVILHTPDNTYGPILSMHWWPWLAAVEGGLLVYYAICEDRLVLETVVKAPKLILYVLILLVTSPWWGPKIRDEVKR